MVQFASASIGDESKGQALHGVAETEQIPNIVFAGVDQQD
jgi:hypothetical protein